MKRAATVMFRGLLVLGSALSIGACGGGGATHSSPADAVTQPIDKAKAVAGDADHREQDIDNALNNP